MNSFGEYGILFKEGIVVLFDGKPHQSPLDINLFIVSSRKQLEIVQGGATDKI